MNKLLRISLQMVMRLLLLGTDQVPFFYGHFFFYFPNRLCVFFHFTFRMRSTDPSSIFLDHRVFLAVRLKQILIKHGREQMIQLKKLEILLASPRLPNAHPRQ
jgi:hypothetical protein